MTPVLECKHSLCVLFGETYCKSEKKARLSNTGIANQEQLE